MILSVHLADLGLRAPAALRKTPVPELMPGLRYAETTIAAPLGEDLLPSPQPSRGRVGLIAAWEDDAALDSFLAGHSLARQLDRGWHVRLEPLRISGAWAGLEGFPPRTVAIPDDEPVGVLTLGRLKLTRVLPFLRASAAAEGAALRSPALLASTGLARPPRFVATFSLWRSVAEMQEYAYRKGAAHIGATDQHRERPFHRESAFLRFRPYASSGLWDGRDPLATVAAVA